MHSLKKGFSLIELLVVIAIIGILAAVGTTGYQVYIDSTKLAVVKNNAATLLQAVSNEDMAQSAGVGGYKECDDPLAISVCAEAILYNSTLSNPFQQNAMYTMRSETEEQDATDFSDAEGLPCEEGSIGLDLNTETVTQPTLSAYFCRDRLMVQHDQAGAKPLYFFTRDPIN